MNSSGNMALQERTGRFVYSAGADCDSAKKVRDPRVDALTITEVRLTRDRRIARVYVASYADEEAIKEGLVGLESARGVLRRELARLLHWPWTPELIFEVDRSWQYGEHMDQLFDKLREERELQEGSGDSDAEQDSTGD